MQLSHALKSGAALAAAGVLALGGASAANAAPIITEGHTDIVAIEGSGSGDIGSGFEQNGIGWESWSTLAVDQLDFDVRGISDPDLVDCDAGVYTIQNEHDVEDYVPFVGFSNHSGSAYEVTLTGDPGVSFDGLNGFDSSGANALQVPVNTHAHGAWSFDTGTGNCNVPATPTSYDFALNFDVVEQVASGVPQSDDHDFTFTLVI